MKLDIPALKDINKKGVNPHTRRINTFFDNLAIEKIKDTSKRVHHITHINFSFKPHKRKIFQKNEVDIDYLNKFRNVYLPDFTIEEIQILQKHGSDEDLKIVSKQYEGYKQQAKIENKVGFMIQTLKNWNSLKKL